MLNLSFAEQIIISAVRDKKSFALFKHPVGIKKPQKSH